MKRERELKKQNRKKEKEERKLQRKTNSDKGKGLEAMMAYVDENGQLSATPPDPSKRTEWNMEEAEAKGEQKSKASEYLNRGKVTFYNAEKGYGFIKDDRTGESVFFHQNDLLTPVKLYDSISFLKVKGQRGIQATEIKLL